MNIEMLKRVLVLLSPGAVGGGIVGGATGGVYGGLSAKDKNESRLGRIAKYLGLGAVGGVIPGAAGSYGGLRLGGRRLAKAFDDGTWLHMGAKELESMANAPVLGLAAGAGAGGVAGGLGTAALTDKYSSAYTQGFISKCGSLGIDPESLVKQALNAATVLNASRALARRSLNHTGALNKLRRIGGTAPGELMDAVDKQKTLGRGISRYGRKLPADIPRERAGAMIDAGDQMAGGSRAGDIMKSLNKMEQY